MEGIGTFEIIVGLLSGGSVIYLIVESIINHRKRREEVKASQVDSVEKAVNYGIPMVQLYEEIDRIVEKKTSPILERLDEAVSELETIKAHWCCYRDACEMRILNARDARMADPDDKYKIIKHDNDKDNA